MISREVSEDGTINIVVPIPGSEYQFHIQSYQESASDTHWIWVIYDLVENSLEKIYPAVEVCFTLRPGTERWTSNLFIEDFEPEKVKFMPGSEMGK